MVERELFLQAGCFDESMEALEDWKLWLDISLLEPIAYCSELLAKYRVYSGSTSRRARKILPLHIKLIDEIFLSPSINAANSTLKSQALSQSYSICSYIAEDSKDYTFSFICAIRSARHSLFKPRHIKRIMRTLINLFPVNRETSN